MINGLVLTELNKDMCEDIVISARKTDNEMKLVFTGWTHKTSFTSPLFIDVPVRR